ncbi:MAG: hypothetical protein M1497_09025 [Nitrospirae bacterium]|nr:hypothetical protein [Nitrospirota bacterium]
MNRTSRFAVSLLFLVLAFSAVVSAGDKKTDPCADEGILVKNLTMLNLWYRNNGGACTIWIHDHILRIKPRGTVEIFSDLICKTAYCSPTPTYKDYKARDTNEDCGVKILPFCRLSDM